MEPGGARGRGGEMKGKGSQARKRKGGGDLSGVKEKGQLGELTGLAEPLQTCGLLGTVRKLTFDKKGSNSSERRTCKNNM